MGGGIFTPKINCHVPCKGGEFSPKKKKKVRHAKKTKIPESSEKDRTLKKEDKGP